tara:strand:- start:40 stop:1410 length:1371 start_codon:yes stop_codon:yes gene_type:complete
MELNIDGVGVVEVDDIFTSLPKNEQEDFINKIKSVYSEEQNDIDLNYGKSEEKKEINIDIDKDKLKKGITGLQFGLGFTPISPISEFVSETGKALIDDKPIKEALKKGASAAAIDIGLRIALMGLPAGSRKVLPKNLFEKLEKGFITRALGKKALMTTKAGSIRNEVIDEVVENPDLLKPSKRTIDQLGKDMANSVQKIQNETGKFIGQLKKEAKATKILVPMDDVIKSSDDKLANSLTEDTAGKKALEKAKLYINKSNNKDIETGLRNLEEIDNSRDFIKIYDKTVKGETLSSGQREALNLRREYNDKILNVIDTVIDNKNLRNLKNQYSKIKGMQKSPMTKTFFKDADSATTKLKQIANTGKMGAYNELRSFSKEVPEINSILDDAIRIKLEPEYSFINSLIGSYGREGGIFRAVGTAPSVIAKPLLRKSPVGKATTGLIRRGAIEAQKILTEE